jgi:DNA polymerase I
MSQTLYIIDGYAQVFRAFFAIRNGMRSPVTGEPTQAVFGITGMLLKLWAQYKPDYVVIAWDAPGKTFRDDLFDGYKATRSPTPDDLKAQIPRIKELFAGFGIPVLEQSGLEADDVIACLVTQLKSGGQNEDLKIRIVSKDKDLEQLLGDGVSMFDVHTDSEMTSDDLYANKGVTPPQVIDLLALTGDTVDNVPGVAGVGPKTAAQLIQQYGSIDGILEHSSEINGKLRERIEQGRGDLLLSRQLVTLHCSSDIGFMLDEARFQPIAISDLISLFQQLGFNRYQDEVKRLFLISGAASQVTKAPTVRQSPLSSEESGTLDLWTTDESIPSANKTPTHTQTTYKLVTNADDLRQAIRQFSSAALVAVEVKTMGAGRAAQVTSVALSAEPGTAYIVPISDDGSGQFTKRAVLDLLKPLLEEAAVTKCGHNLKPGVLALRRDGITMHGIVFDSSLAATLLEPLKSQRIEDLAAERLGVVCCGVDGEGADMSLQLYRQMSSDLKQREMLPLMVDVEGPLVEVIAEMETNGIICDPVELTRQGEVLGLRASALKLEIFEAAGETFDIGSTRKLAVVLFETLGLPAGKKTKTGYSTDVEVLEKLAAGEDKNVPHTAVPRLILEYRQLSKLISTYLGNLIDAIDPATGRIHTTFVQLAAATGRLGSNNPNLQNIPVRSANGKQIRKAFRADIGSRLISADYSQIELRLIAHLSGDPALVGAFERNEDVHIAVASQVFGVETSLVTREQRNQAKMINYAIVYGITPFGLSRRIEGMDVASATELISRYRRQFSGVDVFLQECIDQAKTNGYVSTMLGRRRQIPEIEARQPNIRSLGERLAINSVVQGSAADLIKVAMVNLHRRIDRERLPLKMLLQIHDELVMESPEEYAVEMGSIVIDEMQNAMHLTVPLTAECGIASDWMGAK